MNGILIVDKPSGLTSHDVINKLRKLTGIKKIGHTGTLDPNATGVLVVCLGEATKLIPYLEEGNKAYSAEVIFGSETDTDDSTGTITQTSSLNTDLEILKKVLVKNTGKFEQTVPIYSAKKIKGKKLYEYARKNEQVELPKNSIEIFSIELKDDSDFPEKVTIDVECSKGTYIRSLVRDIGIDFNTLAHMGNLRRTKSNTFKISDSVTLDDLNSENIGDYLIPFNQINLELPKINISDQGVKYFKNGNQLFGRNLLDDIENLESDQLVALNYKDNLSGIGKIKKVKNRKVIQPIRIFNI